MKTPTRPNKTEANINEFEAALHLMLAEHRNRCLSTSANDRDVQAELLCTSRQSGKKFEVDLDFSTSSNAPCRAI
jgi:hypothetical protein